MEHGTDQRYGKMREVSEAAAVARSLLHKKVRQLRSSATRPSQPTAADKSQHASATSNQHTAADINERPTTSESKHPAKVAQQSSSGITRKHLMDLVTLSILLLVENTSQKDCLSSHQGRFSFYLHCREEKSSQSWRYGACFFPRKKCNSFRSGVI